MLVWLAARFNCKYNFVYTERDDDMHVISLRKAEKYEARYYFEVAQEHFHKGH
jgi:uncharacterized DUF497 family protein